MVAEHGSDAREHGTWTRFKYLDDVRWLLLPSAPGLNPTDAKMQDVTNWMNGEPSEILDVPVPEMVKQLVEAGECFRGQNSTVECGAYR